MRLTLRRIRRGARTEQGAVAVIVAVCVAALLVCGGIVLDFGMVRMERQTNKSAADSAVMAGLRAADGGNDSVYNALGVCAALEYLKANRPALSGLGSALETGGSCAIPSTSQVCTPVATVPNPSQVTYHSSTTFGSTRYEVWIKSPYKVTDAGTGGPMFAGETLASSTPGDANQYGCDQIGLVIKESTKPGLGKMVTSSDLVTRIRSVGRVAVGPGDQAPALLLLDTAHCHVLELAAGGAGADSHIRVKGSTVYMAKRADGTPGDVNTAGSIHSDSTGTTCSGGGNPAPPVVLGKATDGVVAYGAPDGSKSGTITSVAGFNGAAAATVYDSISNVYGTTAKDELSSGTPTPPTGHAPVTRKVVDDRYLGSTAVAPTTGVKGAITDAETSVFSAATGVTAANAVSKGYRLLANCNPTAAQISAALITATSDVFVDCTSPGFKGTAPIPGKKIVFNGQIQPTANVQLPDATSVYVFGSGSGINASGGFSMNTTGHMDPVTGMCTNAVNPSRATLFVKDGGITATGGLLRLCNTTVFLMGNRPNGCTSSISYTVAPVTAPCGGGSGNGLIKIGGTAVQDWTAPNTIDDMSLLDEPTKKGTYWQNKAGLEDLALWSETYGTGSDWQMAGGGTMHLVGVFMTPNASPFVVKGGATQQLSNAQYVASSFQLTGGATLEMKVDANNVISFPMLTPFSLVR